MNSTQTPHVTTNTATSATPDSSKLGDKIARLPKPTRDMINLMLEDGLPYRVIIDELAETGRGLTPQSLAKWLQTGHEDYLQNREKIDTAKTQAEFAADLLQELGGIDATTVHQACLVLTSVQMFNAIAKYRDEALRKMLNVKPATYLSLINTLCNTLQPMISLENRRTSPAGSATGILPANSGAGVPLARRNESPRTTADSQNANRVV